MYIFFGRWKDLNEIIGIPKSPVIFQDLQIFEHLTDAHVGTVPTAVYLVGVYTEAYQPLRENTNLIFQAQPHPHVKIGKLGHAGAIETALFITYPAQHGAGMAQGVPLVKEVVQPLMAAAVRLVKDMMIEVGFIFKRAAILGYSANPGEDCTDLRIFIQESAERLTHHLRDIRLHFGVHQLDLGLRLKLRTRVFDRDDCG